MPRPPSAKDLLERQVTQQHKDYLCHRGWRPVRFQRTVIPGQFQTGEPGIPDYLFIYYPPPGGTYGAVLLLWLELKRPRGGKRLKDQETWHYREQRRGAVVVTSSDIAEFDRWYTDRFGWLHGRNGCGQISLLTEME